jgi:hypothetical protein
MTNTFVQTLEEALKSTVNGITHPSDREYYYAGISKMIQNGLTPAEFESMRSEFRDVIKKYYPSIVSDIHGGSGSDFHAMHFGVTKSNALVTLI